MSDSLRPHRRQPTRLPCPSDTPGKNTGVGCHFLLQCMKVKSESEVAQSCPTQRPHGLQPTRLLCPWDFPGKSTGVGCHCLLRFYIFPNINLACLEQPDWDFCRVTPWAHVACVSSSPGRFLWCRLSRATDQGLGAGEESVDSSRET